MRIALLCLMALVGAARAEHLPFRTYTTSDGLANNRVDRGTRDARGFLWFATAGGVSRFDGEQFVSYGTADGLPTEQTLDILAADDGTIWAATDGGIAWLDPAERTLRPRFHAIAGPAAYAVVEGGSQIWIGSEAGLSRFEHGALHPVTLGPGTQPSVQAIAYDARDGSLWLGTWRGLLHRRSDGTVEHYHVAPVTPVDDRVSSLLVDRTGRLWIGHIGAAILGIPLRPGQPLTDSTRPLWELAQQRQDWLHYAPHGWARRKLLEDSRGTIWIGTTRDVVRYQHGAFEELSASRTGVDYAAAPCVEDAAGNLWFGSEAGVHRLTRAGPVVFDRDDGLGSGIVYGFYQPTGGPLHVVIDDEYFEIARRDADAFVRVLPKVPAGVRGAWGVAQLLAFDRDGRWWYPTSNGIARYPRVDRLEDLATHVPEIIGEHEGLPGRDVFRVYEDSRGDIWIATLSATGLTRWDHTTGTLTTLGTEWPRSVAVSFTEDRAGTLWIGFADGSLVRVRDGRPHTFHGGELPDGAFAALLFDAAGHLWIASDHEGVALVEDPNADVLHVRRYRVASTQAMTLVDDDAGNIYVGTTRGIDRIDPATGTAAHFGTREGLPSEYVHCSLRDRDGSLWFGTKRGAVRLPPERVQRQSIAPLVYFAKISVTNEPVPLVAGGERAPPPLELEPDQHQLDIEFAAPSFVVGTLVQFQYRLDEGSWSQPTNDRFVHFARLGAGSYHFEVRSLLPDGTASAPASLQFVIKPPIWRRWWFVLLAAVTLAATAFALYRWRLAHALAVERVRTRIASDLHDELGANLSRIAILSEVASRRAGPHDEIVGPIGDIGRSARELVDVAADIVWSTDPRRDDLYSVIVRLRHFAGDVLEARGIEWSLQGPDDPASIKLSPDCRRHLYLIVKEAIHNVARHSSAQTAWIAIKSQGRELHASIRDDGRGFDEASLARRGNGLDNMRARAREAGGTLTVTSAPDGGTEIRCELPG